MALSLFHLHGDLKDLSFPRLLATLSGDRFTGVFQATTGGADTGPESAETTREVHFSDGHIAWAISTQKEESLRAFMLRNGSLTESQWAEAERQARGGTVRDALVTLELVNARELTQIEKGRAEEILLALFSADDGEYRIRERQLPPGTPDLKIDPRPLILKGVLEKCDHHLVMEEVGSLDAVFSVKRSHLDEMVPVLPGEFQSVLKHLDGRRSIAQILSQTSLPDNFVCSVLAALSMTGAIKRQTEKTLKEHREQPKSPVPSPAPTPARAIEAAPRAVEPAPRATEAASRVIEPAPRATEAAPRVIEPAPRATEAAPRVIEPAPRAIEAAPRVIEPAPRAIEAAPAPRETMRPEAQLVLNPAAIVEETSEPIEAIEVLDGLDEFEEELEPDRPPITMRPFTDPGTIEEIVEESDDEEAPSDAPAAPSYYGSEAPREASRPWFLLGAGAAVGLAALFLILMSHGDGDAVEVIRPVSQAAPALAASLGDEAPASLPYKADIPEEADTRAVPAMTLPPQPVAPVSRTDILSAKSRSSQSARASLASGDFAAASRQFGREFSSRGGEYTIQLLTACQDETVQKAVDSAGNSSRLFILPATVEGRRCYRVYWGTYPTQTRAQEALRREVPRPFRVERSQPRVTRLGGA